MSKVGFDPGHGEPDPGAIGPSGLKEKDVTLNISLKASEKLRTRGINIFLTRVTDMRLGNTVQQDLNNRTRQLNNADCDLAISVHVNSSLNKAANYISTFIQGKGGEAEKLANKVQPKLVEATGWPDGGVRVQNLHMTRETKMPAIIVECGFISNVEQERQLRDPAVQEKIAQAIVDGVLEYMGMGDDIMQDVTVIVKGKEIPGKLIGGQTYVPLRETVEALSNQVIWQGKDKPVVVK